MALKEFFRKLYFQVKRRNDTTEFVMSEFYFPDEQEEIENLEVGETHVSITAKLQPNL